MERVIESSRVLQLLLAMAAATIPAAVRGEAPATPDNVVFEAGIEFARPDGEPLTLNLARPRGEAAGAGPRPAVVCIHGGGFRAGTLDAHNALCVKLASRGFVAVTVSYRLAPKHPFPAAVHDVKAAVRWLRANAAKYDADPERIGALGDSAGGHLALFLGVTAGVKQFEPAWGNLGVSSDVACVVSIYGPSDFTKSYGKSVDAAEVLPLFLGGNLEQERRKHILASPLYWVTPAAPPVLCIHGTQDAYVAHEQAVWIVDRLRACEVDAELVTLDGAGHGFKGADLERAEAALMAFLEKKLKRPPIVSGGGEGRQATGVPTAQTPAPPKSLAADEIQLVVRGDDLGIAQGVNAAAIEAYEHGIVRSVEVIVPGPWFLDAVERLKKVPDLDVGVHLALTSEWERCKWRPLTHAPSLVDENGYFFPMTSQRKDFPPNTGFIDAKPRLDEVERELRAQIELLRKHLPRVSHVSAHMGAAMATPELRELTRRLAAEYGLGFGDGGQALKSVGGFPGKTPEEREAALVRAIEGLGPGRWLLVEHPAQATDETRALGHKGYENVGEDRAGVLYAFLSPRVKAAIEKKGVRLLSYRDLK